ncbi:hypothetical protein ACEPAF_5203 [Sanghuangporus sanghuang]
MTDSLPIHGNYRGYYTKRPSFHDPRLALIPSNIFKDARILDIGCNEGWVTCEIAQQLQAKEVIGVDIDDGLIRAAWKRRRTVWSQRPRISSPSQSSPSDSRDEQKPKRSKRPHSSQGEEKTKNRTERGEQLYSFPAAFEHMFGPLPIPPAESPGERSQFPHNVVFRATDWLKEGTIDDWEGYDVVLALSISKWIHLNNGDEGLLSFFQRIFSVLRSDGIFILEPQGWETYHKAKRMDPGLKKIGDSLRLRPADFERELLKVGFRSVEHLGQTGKGGFQRALDLYRK